MAKTTKIFLLKGKKPNEYLITRLHTLFCYAGYTGASLLKEQVHDSKVEFTVAPKIEWSEGHAIIRSENEDLSRHGFVLRGIIGVAHSTDELADRVYRLAMDIAMKLSEQPGFYGEKYEFQDLTDEWWRKK